MRMIISKSKTTKRSLMTDGHQLCEHLFYKLKSNLQDKFRRASTSDSKHPTVKSS